MRETQIGLDSYSRGQELPTQVVHHAGLGIMGRHKDYYRRRRYDVVTADASNNIPYETLRIRNLNESAWDETFFDGYGYHPFHTGSYVSGILDNTESNTVFRSEAVFDPIFYKHYKSEHHDRESRYFEKEDVSMSAFDVLEYMSGSKYYDLPFDENIYSYRTGLQEEWMLELIARQTFNLRQEHPMSATTGIHRKITRTDYSAEIRNSNIQELYFEDWPVLLSYGITETKTDADHVRAAESFLNGEFFFEENDININPLLDDPIGIPNAHDIEIMNQIYHFSDFGFNHSSDILKVYPDTKPGLNRFYRDETNKENSYLNPPLIKDSSLILDQSDSYWHGIPFNLFYNDGKYIDIRRKQLYNSYEFEVRPDEEKYYMGNFLVRYEINGSAVSKSSYDAAVISGSYEKAQIKIDRNFRGRLMIWTSGTNTDNKAFRASFAIDIIPYYENIGGSPIGTLNPFNSYNKRNHINGHSGHIAEPSQRYDSIAFRGLRR